MPSHVPITAESTAETVSYTHLMCIRDSGYRYSGRYSARIVDTFTGATDVSTVEPADAGAEGTYRCEITWPEATVSASTRLSVRSTADEYQVEIDLDVTDGDETVARKRWHEVIPRHLQ